MARMIQLLKRSKSLDTSLQESYLIHLNLLPKNKKDSYRLVKMLWQNIQIFQRTDSNKMNQLHSNMFLDLETIQR